MGSARKLMGGFLGVVAGVAKHAAWYLRYQLDGHAHDQPEHAARAGREQADGG